MHVPHARLTLVALAASTLAACALACGDTRGDDPSDTAGGDAANARTDAGDAGDADPDSPPAPPLDLVPWARVTASATAGVPWPREARDGPATVRDGHPDTGWVPPADGPSELVVDWAPWTGGPVRITEISFELSEGAAPATIALLDACGGTELLRFADAVPGTLTIADELHASCLTLAFDSPGALRLRSLAVIARDAAATEPAPALGPNEALEITRPDAGLIEGFYGVPWSWRERADALRALALHGMGTYVYAPKWDPLHRDSWRDPYPSAFVDDFEALAALGRTLGVEVVFGISPFGDWRGDEDFDVLLAKLAVFADRGVRSFALLADDIEFVTDRDVDDAMGAEQVAAVQAVLAHLRTRVDDPEIWFVPTVYSGGRRTSLGRGDDYLRALRGLDPDVRVMWTGDDVFDPELLVADLDEVRELVGRPLAIWDNYWANDGGDGFFGRLLLGAYRNRELALLGATTGLANNASIQGALARLQLHMFAHWAAGGADDPVAARAFAATTERRWNLASSPTSPEDALLVLLLETFDGATNADPRNRRYDQAVDALAGALDAAGGEAPPEEAALAVALRAFVRMAGVRSEVHHSALHPDLVDDLWFALERSELEGELALLRLRELRLRLSGEDPTELRARVGALTTAAARLRFQASAGTAARLGALVGAARALDAPLPPPAYAGPPAPCVAGRPLSWSPFPDASAAFVGGLPEARTDDGAIDWTPPHPGRFRAVVAAIEDGPTWDFRIEQLVCTGG